MTVRLQTLRSFVPRQSQLVAVIFAMAAGITSAVTATSVAYVAVVKPLPFKAHENLYNVGLFSESDPYSHPSGGLLEFEVADLAREIADLAEAAAFRTGWLTVGSEGGSDRVGTTFATVSLLEILGVSPSWGRGFENFDANPAEPARIIVSQSFWRSRFADAEFGVTDVRVNRSSATVVGVLPAWFTFPERQSVFVPIALKADGTLDGFSLVARLHAASSPLELKARLATWREEQARRDPDRWKGVALGAEHLSGMFVNRSDRQAIGGMVIAAIMTLLVSLVSSVAGLAAHLLSGVQVVAVKIALGATRLQIVQRYLLGGAGIGLVSGIIAIPFAQRAILALNERILLRGDYASPPWLRLEIVPGILALVVICSILIVAALSLAISFRMTRLSISSVLNDPSRTHPGGWFTQMIRILLIVQAGAAAALVVAGSGLQLSVNRSFESLGETETGGLVIATLELDQEAYPDAETQQTFVSSLIGKVQRNFGHTRVSASSVLPAYDAERANYQVHYSTGEVGSGYLQYGAADPHFGEVAGLNVVSGRFFNERDTSDSLPVAVVDDRFAKRHQALQPLVGSQIRLWPNYDNAPLVTIIGVIQPVDLLPEVFGESSHPVLLRPFSQNPYRHVYLAVDTMGGARPAATRTLRQVIADADRMIPVDSIKTLAMLRNERAAGARIFADVMSVMGVVALILAACGIYNVFSYRAITKAKDIAICQSLGASPFQSVLLVARNDLIVLAFSIASGTAIGYVLLKIAQASLWRTTFDIGATDLVVPLALIVIAAVLALSKPMRIATRRDVLTAFKQG